MAIEDMRLLESDPVARPVLVPAAVLPTSSEALEVHDLVHENPEGCSGVKS